MAWCGESKASDDHHERFQHRWRCAFYVAHYESFNPRRYTKRCFRGAPRGVLGDTTPCKSLQKES